MSGEVCGEQYGQNPDTCYRKPGHPGAHTNVYGCTWATADMWIARRGVPLDDQQKSGR